MEKIQEYDIEIKPLKDIKGQGLCKLIMNGGSVDGMISISIGEPLVYLEWHRVIIFYSRSRKFTVTMNPKERRTLNMKENKYVLIIDILFRRNYDGIPLRCVDENQSQELMREFHEGICGGKFAPIVFRENEETCNVVTSNNCRTTILSMGTLCRHPNKS